MKPRIYDAYVAGMTTRENPCSAATTWVVSANTWPVICFGFLFDLVCWYIGLRIIVYCSSSQLFSISSRPITATKVTASTRTVLKYPLLNIHMIYFLFLFLYFNKYRLRQCQSKSKVSPYSITERRVPELIPVLGSQPAGDVSHKPGGRLPLLPARPAVTVSTLKRAAANFAAWWTEVRWVWTVCLRLLPDSVAAAI